LIDEILQEGARLEARIDLTANVDVTLDDGSKFLGMEERSHGCAV
jgi:hypothetical protein